MSLSKIEEEFNKQTSSYIEEMYKALNTEIEYFYTIFSDIYIKSYPPQGDLLFKEEIIKDNYVLSTITAEYINKKIVIKRNRDGFKKYLEESINKLEESFKE